MTTGSTRLVIAVAGGVILALSLHASAHSQDAPESFDHRMFDELLGLIVSPIGDVDYPRLLEHRELLDRYMAQLAKHSPYSSPHLFEGRDALLAYWLNAYNACVLKGVADHYPIDSVGEVRGGVLGGLLRLVDDKIPFFLNLRFELGGQTINLFRLEHHVIRPFGDPRIHFALNCASGGCPPLRAEAYVQERLDEQLQSQAVLFAILPRGVEVRDDAIVVSAIFDWFRGDFEGYVRAEHPELPATVRSYLELFLGPLPPDLPLEFSEYDWQLNDASRPATGEWP